jgi:hypothetical protein
VKVSKARGREDLKGRRIANALVLLGLLGTPV